MCFKYKERVLAQQGSDIIAQWSDVQIAKLPKKHINNIKLAVSALVAVESVVGNPFFIR